MIGKLLFSLSSELINPDLNKGLPPNLAADDPSLSFTMKGVDVNMAAYMSELAFLTNPVTSHVQSAEMHNQPINSLALISARYTMQATELVGLMCAAHLYVVCQALDLRVLHGNFLERLRSEIPVITRDVIKDFPAEYEHDLHQDIEKRITQSWNSSTPFDLEQRCHQLAESTLPALVSHAGKHGFTLAVETMVQFKKTMEKVCQAKFVCLRDEFFHKPTTDEFLGNASRQLYLFVREELGVPFHQGLVEHPGRNHGEKINGRPRRTIGSWISVVYAAIRDGRAWEPMMRVLSPN
jgi:phenylalanine ammonia-lyase